MDLFARTVVYEDRAAKAINAAGERWNIEDALNAIEWTLIHDPEFGAALNERGVRGFIYPGAVSLNEPDIDVIYEYQNPRIIIHSLTFTGAKAHYAGKA